MAFKLLDRVSAIGASRSIKIARGTTNHTVDVELEHRAATKISAATVVLQGSTTDDDGKTGVITTSGLAIGSTAERVATSLMYYRINNTNYTKAAEAAGSQFSAAHVVTAEKYGVVLCFLDSAGTFTSKVVSATQAYDTAEEAHAAADAVLAAASNNFPTLCYIGRILILAEAGNDWNANTDDMTDGSDLTTATFIPATSSFYDLTTHALDAGEITAGRAMFHTDAKTAKYIRVFLSALTGTGYVTVRYTPTEIR